MSTGTAGISKLKNVTIHRTLTRSGDDTWMLIHKDGWRDPYFDHFANYLLETKLSKFNTRELYCRSAAGYTDYLIEAAKWYVESCNGISLTAAYREAGSAGREMDLSGLALAELTRIYPKVLAGGAHSRDPVVVELTKRLNRKVSAPNSQGVHIAAVNHYLALSEAFSLRLQQSGLQEIHGLPVLSEGVLFQDIGTAVELSRFERMALSNRSLIGGVVAGGPRIKRLAILKPVVTDVDDGEATYDYDSAFPLESAPDLINRGFHSYRDRALYCLLMASGIRISEALTLTWSDIDCKKRQVYVRNPRTKHLEKVYLGFLSLEERNRLPWKGRTHPVTLLIEPFASEFWRLLERYAIEESFLTSAHSFVFQVLQGDNASDPLILSDQSNLRKAFKEACRRIDIEDCYSAHSLRHMYGVYLINFWPRADGSFGLPATTVQQLMGHTHLDSTMHYAKPDTLILEIEQRINARLLSGFKVEDRAGVRVKVLQHLLDNAMAESQAALNGAPRRKALQGSR